MNRIHFAEFQFFFRNCPTIYVLLGTFLSVITNTECNTIYNNKAIIQEMCVLDKYRVSTGKYIDFHFLSKNDQFSICSQFAMEIPAGL